jgi:hypothetical protein
MVHQVQGHVDFADGVEVPGGDSGEGPDLGDGAVDELEEIVLVALCFGGLKLLSACYFKTRFDGKKSKIYFPEKFTTCTIVHVHACTIVPICYRNN